VEKVGLIRIPFTEEEVKALDDEPYHHPHPRVQKKMEAISDLGLLHCILMIVVRLNYSIDSLTYT